MAWKGKIIEESLLDQDILHRVKIINREKIKPTDKEHAENTWFVSKIEVCDEKLEFIRKLAQNSLRSDWSCCLKNKDERLVIFEGKSFKIKKDDSKAVAEIKKYAKSKGIPRNHIEI